MKWESEQIIQTFHCDQTNSTSIELFFSKCPIKTFDVIIDDGLHSENAASIFFENSFSKLREGGLYFIEEAWWWDGEGIAFLENRDIKYFVFGESSHNILIMVIK